ncbi:hypothetical protein CWI84_02970 [Idiomarina tyrosinivorans]|uniref:Uncharacterized protein n=1 Tax=Idiomarina tyrosinivorans TaxID=1445662 RepID=A0A432ZTE1_9GAMM|nr:hypothetical protein [Idiomarina tyrosinivorans]RUO81088.1 hypothetical protein CWI84_02970 [Idiomarina tyrosinivorans]
MLSVPWISDLKDSNLGHLLAINSRLERVLATYPDLDKLTVSEKSNAKQLTRGMLTDFPIYTVLFFRSKSHHRLLEQMKQLIWLESPLATDNDISDYCRFIRVLSEKNIPQFIVERFPKHEPSASEIYEFLDYFSENEAQSVTDDSDYNNNLKENTKAAIRYLKVLTGRTVNRRTYRGKSKSSKKRQSLGIRGFTELDGHSVVKYLTIPDEDELFDTGFVRALESLELDQDELDDIGAQGVEPAEFEKRYRLAWYIDISSPLYAQNFRAKVKQKGQIAKIERHNQYLPSTVHLMNEVEATALFERLENYPVQSKNEAAVVLTLYIMLLTSSSFERAKSFSLLFTQDQGASRIADSIGYDLSLNVWLVPRLRLPFTTAEANLPDALIPQETIELPTYTDRVKELITQFFKSQKAPAKPLLKMRTKISQVTNFLKSISERLTPAKVSNYLILNLSSSTSISVAGYLFNRALPGSMARYYYSSHTEYEYQRIYDDLVKNTLPICNFHRSSGLYLGNPVSNFKYSFGARYVPSVDSIRKTLALMKASLHEERHKTKSLSFIDFHNCYTVYCIFAQSLLTGIRAVVDPFIGSRQVIEQTGLAIFRDKDTKDQFHTRVLPFHSLALKLSQEYERHSKIILEKMLLINPLFCRSKIFESDTTFFIEPETTQALTARPREIKRFLSPFSELPINSNRKFLRSYLEKQRLSPETVDATLGHASLGEPIGDSMSTFSFLDLREELFPALDSLIEEVELVLLKGIAE